MCTFSLSSLFVTHDLYRVSLTVFPTSCLPACGEPMRIKPIKPYTVMCVFTFSDFCAENISYLPPGPPEKVIPDACAFNLSTRQRVSRCCLEFLWAIN